jgi:hypothetical protein
MPFYWLTLGVLVVWRITHFLYAEDGPLDVGVHLRRLAGSGIWGRLLDCFYCLSVWIAAPVALWIGEGTKHRVLLWPALSAGAILLERLTSVDRRPSPPLYFEHEGKQKEDELLRDNTESLAS